MVIAGALLLSGCESRTVDPDGVVHATLSNGLRVVIVRNALAPVVATDLAYLVGSRDEPPDIPGLAHAQEHMMFRGTRAIPTDVLATVTTALGGHSNAETDDTVTQYTFTVPADDLDVVLRIEADRMRGIADDDSQWRIERGVIDEEVNESNSTPGSDFIDEVHALAYRGTPLERPVVGTIPAFDRLDGPRLKEFYDRWYAPNNAVLVVAGDIDPDVVLGQIRSRFGDIPARPVPAHDLRTLAPFVRHRIVKKLPLTSPRGFLAFRFPGLRSADTYASAVLQAMLSDDAGPVNMMERRDDVDSASWDADPPNDRAQLAMANFKLTSDSDPARAVASIEAAVAAYVRRGVPRLSFERAKHQLMRDQDARTNIEDQAINWVQTVAIDREPSNRREIERFAVVTREDVNRVARRYMARANTVVGILTPFGRGAGIARDVPRPKRRLERVSSMPPTPSGVPDWGMRAINVPPAAVLATNRIRLSNGLTLVVRSTPGTQAIRLIGDVQIDRVPEADPGWMAWEDMKDMFSQTTLFSPIADSESTGSAGPSFELHTTPKDFERAMAVLAQHELRPRFMRPTLAGPGLVARLRADSAIRSAFARTVRPDRTTIVIAGDIAAERARAVVERLFGKWHAQGSGPARRATQAQEIPIAATFKVPGKADSVWLTQNITLPADDPRTYALQLGNTIFGGGSGNGDQNRISRRMRQTAGLVYGINSSYVAKEGYGELDIWFVCAPRDERRIIAMVDEEVERMRTTPVSDFELRVAKAEEVRNLTLIHSSLDTSADALLAAARDGGMDHSRSNGERLRSVDAASIQRAFAKYIHPAHFTRLVVGP